LSLTSQVFRAGASCRAAALASLESVAGLGEGFFLKKLNMVGVLGIAPFYETTPQTAARQRVMATSTLQGACSIKALEIEPRHQRAVQLSRCR